ncbi:MAG TPA: twin-arginine translocase subunit TatC [Phycisphaerales bacterium]
MPDVPDEQPQDRSPPDADGPDARGLEGVEPVRPEDRRGVMGERRPNLLAGVPREDEPEVGDREDLGTGRRREDDDARAIVRAPRERDASRDPSRELGEKVMSLGDHLDELRTRVIHALWGIAILFFGSLYFGPTVLNWMIKPVQAALRAEGLPATMLATGMFETFFTYLKISTVASVALGFPWILWQLWKFVAPGLYRHERRFVTMLLPMSLVLTILSSLFLYFVVLPVMLHFFVHFGTTVSPTQAAVAPMPEGVAPLNIPVLAADPPAPKVGDVWFNSDLKELRLALVAAGAAEGAKPLIYSTPLSTSSGILLQPKIREWVDTLLGLALAFAAGFQLPVVVLLLGWIGVVTPAFLTKYRLHALFVIAVIAALITPPDPISMLIMMAPLYVLYEVSIWMLRVFPASRVAGDTGGEPDGEPSEG